MLGHQSQRQVSAKMQYANDTCVSLNARFQTNVLGIENFSQNYVTQPILNQKQNSNITCFHPNIFAI